MNLTYVPSLTVSGSEGSRPGPWAPAANRLGRSRKKVIYSLGPAVSRTFFRKFLSPAPRPASRAARRLGAALPGRPLVRRLSYNTPSWALCKRFRRLFSIDRQLFWIAPGQSVSAVLNFFTLLAIEAARFTVYKSSAAARTKRFTMPRNSFMKADLGLD